METATITKKETEFRSEQFTFTIPRYMDELGLIHDSESFTFKIPRNKKGLIEELRRLKKEDSINISAYIVDALEKRIGHFSYISGLWKTV